MAHYGRVEYWNQRYIATRYVVVGQGCRRRCVSLSRLGETEAALFHLALDIRIDAVNHLSSLSRRCLFAFRHGYDVSFAGAHSLTVSHTVSHPRRDVEPFYEWYQTFASLRHFLTNEFLAPAATALKPNTYSSYHAMTPPTPTATSPAPTFPPRSRCRTLILGCGNSRFGEDMLRDGWTGGIVNVDFSPVVIDHMKAKYNDAFYQRLGVSKTSRMEFVCADITKGALAAYDDGSFDLILCKGTFDAILSSAGSVANAKLVVQECHRLLADNHGVFMLVTFGNADSRVAFLEHQGDLGYYWQGVSVHTVPRKTRHSQESPSVVKCVSYCEGVTQLDDACVVASSHTTSCCTVDSYRKDYVYICRKCAGAPQSPIVSPYASLNGPNERNVVGEENEVSTAPCKRSYPNRF